MLDTRKNCWKKSQYGINATYDCLNELTYFWEPSRAWRHFDHFLLYHGHKMHKMCHISLPPSMVSSKIELSLLQLFFVLDRVLLGQHLKVRRCSGRYDDFANDIIPIPNPPFFPKEIFFSFQYKDTGKLYPIFKSKKWAINWISWQLFVLQVFWLTFMFSAKAALSW